MANMKKSDALMTKASEQPYSKQQLMASQKYAHRRDLIAALLEDGKTYPLAEVDTLIKNYNERKM